MQETGTDSNDWNSHFLLTADVDLSGYTGTSFNIIAPDISNDDDFQGSRFYGVDFEDQQIHVSPKKETAKTIDWEPKDHEKCVVPMADETAQLPANLPARAKEGFPYISISPKGLEEIQER